MCHPVVSSTCDSLIPPLPLPPSSPYNQTKHPRGGGPLSSRSHKTCRPFFCLPQDGGRAKDSPSKCVSKTNGPKSSSSRSKLSKFDSRIGESHPIHRTRCRSVVVALTPRKHGKLFVTNERRTEGERQVVLTAEKQGLFFLTDCGGADMISANQSFAPTSPSHRRKGSLYPFPPPPV